jgi:hypothetical protein
MVEKMMNENQKPNEELPHLIEGTNYFLVED